jgi:hypothetical protein
LVLILRGIAQGNLVALAHVASPRRDAPVR